MSPTAYARRHAARFVAELSELVAIPSVSADRRRAPDMQRCARRLAQFLTAARVENVRLLAPPRAAPPVVAADWLHAPGAPTVLVYGHYDVQPADERWEHPPFSPLVRGDELLGRGASDDKGQLFAHVKALECALGTRHALPVNVRVIFEGEEEIGSAGLLALMASRPELFAADVAVISDMPIIAPDEPAITHALRGSVNATVTVTREGRELHSGLFGGAIADPLMALCELAASLRDSRGRIRLPGFYDRVRDVSARERGELERVATRGGGPLAAAAGAPEETRAEPDYTAAERTTIRPALTITSLDGGYHGDGHKTVLGTSATLKLNLRLVPDQDPQRVFSALRRHLQTHLPAGLRLTITAGATALPVMIDRAHPAIAAAARAYQRAFGRRPWFRRSAGSIPVAAALKHRLGIEPLLLGLALPDDHAHGPNEKMHLPTFFRGIDMSIALLEELAAQPARRAPVTTYPEVHP